MTDEKLTPPEPVEPPIEAAPPVKPVEPEKAPTLLPDVPAEQLLDLKQRANAWVDNVASLKPQTPEYEQQVRAIQQVARSEVRQTANASSRFLEKSVAQTKSEGGSGTQVSVSKTLVDLRTKVEELAPGEQNWFEKLASRLPGGKQMQRYFRQFESNQDQLNTILVALDRGQDVLLKDNSALQVERKALWDSMTQLQKLSSLLGELDEAVTRRIEEEKTAGALENAQALESDVLFAVRQRHQDVMTQLAVSVQSYLAMGLIQDNNLKLVDGVERAKTTTMTALRTAVIVAQALENQKLVLDQIDAVNRTTNQMIERTSQMLRDNTARVQEQAVNSGVQFETLQRAFDNVFATIDQVEQFRRTANTNFASTITALEGQVERANPYLERSRRNELTSQQPTSSELLPPELQV